MVDTDPATVKAVGKLLDRLVGVQKRSGDEQEIAYDEVAASIRGLPRVGLVEAVDQAASKNARYSAFKLELLAMIADDPAVGAALRSLFSSLDVKERCRVLNAAAVRRAEALLPLVNDAMTGDPDLSVRRTAISSAGEFNSQESIPSLRKVIANHPPELRSGLLWALRSFRLADSRPLYENAFKTSRDLDDKIVAAWGLGNLGDAEARDFLVETLRTEARARGVRALRAAQALCDVLGWPFEWHMRYVKETLRRLEDRVRRN